MDELSDYELDKLYRTARLVREALRELEERGVPIAEFHTGRAVAIQMATLASRKMEANWFLFEPTVVQQLIDENNSPFGIGTIAGIPVICLDRGDDNWCEASFRQMYS